MAAAGIAATMAMGVVSIPLAHADDLHDRQKQVEKKLESADHALEDSSARLQRAYAALRAAQADLAQARRQLEQTLSQLAEARERNQELKERLAVAQARLEQARADLAAGRADLDVQRAAVTDMVTSIYQEGDPQLQAFSSMLHAEDPADLTWTQEGQSVMVGRETKAYDQLRAAEVLLAVREEQLDAAEATVAEQQAEAAEQVTVMQGLTSEARAARSAVREVVDRRRDAKAQAQQAKARDLAQIRKLKEQEQRIREKIARLAARTSGGYNGAAGGFLGWPMQGGYVTSSYGMRVHPIYGYYGLHNGIDFGGGCGVPLLAAGSGTVVAKYYSSSYGNRLFIYVGKVNGVNLSVVYNHASGYRVDVGQRVSRGQVVGATGDSGWSTGCHLHFTVLANGRPVDPMKYL